MNHPKAQRGMTAIGWLIVLVLIGFFTLIALRLTPVYLDYYKVASTLDSLNDEPMITQKSVPEIRDLISRRFEVNDVSSVTPKDVDIREANGVLHVGIDYNVRRHMLGNVDLLVHFDKQVQVISH